MPQELCHAQTKSLCTACLSLMSLALPAVLKASLQFLLKASGKPCAISNSSTLAGPTLAVCMFLCRGAKALAHVTVSVVADVCQWGMRCGMRGTAGGTLCCCCFSLALRSRHPRCLLSWFCPFKPSASLDPFVPGRPHPAVWGGW